MPALSIITPVFNGIRFIESCIQNVINQNCNEIEHLVIDGGSTDGTLEIITKYAENHSHIRYISKKDNGQSEAMNRGIRFAKGEIIGFLNVDDLYKPNILNRVLGLFEYLPKPTFAAGICEIVDGDMNHIYYNSPSKTSFYQLLSLRYRIPENPAAYFYHKELHNQVGYYDEVNHNHYAMDLDFILRLSKQIDFIFFNQIWGVFVMHEKSKTFLEIQDRSIYKRILKIFKRYYRELPLYAKMKVLYIRHPHFFFSMIYDLIVKSIKPKEISRIFSEPLPVCDLNAISTSQNTRSKPQKMIADFADLQPQDIKWEIRNEEIMHPIHDDMRKLLQLTETLDPKIILELGTAYGNRTANLCQVSNAKIYTVNPLPPQVRGKITTYKLNKKMIGTVYKKYDFEERVIQIYENTLNLDLNKYFSKCVDLAIIDASHDFKYVVNDFKKVVSSVKSDGVVLIHNTDPSMKGQLAQSYLACQHLRVLGFDIRHLRDTCWGVWKEKW